jgi:hypothetical protein
MDLSYLHDTSHMQAYVNTQRSKLSAESPLNLGYSPRGSSPHLDLKSFRLVATDFFMSPILQNLLAKVKFTHLKLFSAVELNDKLQLWQRSYQIAYGVTSPDTFKDWYLWTVSTSFQKRPWRATFLDRLLCLSKSKLLIGVCLLSKILFWLCVTFRYSPL